MIRKGLVWACLLVLVWAGSGMAAELVHRWSFNGDLTDSVGGADAVIVDDGANDATLDFEQVTLAGGPKGASDYVDLPDGIINAIGDSATFEIWATQNAVQNWSRIFDFGTSTADNIFMSWTVATNLNSDRVEWLGDEDDTSDGTNAPYQLGVEYHIVMVIDGDAGEVRWYSAPADSPTLGGPRGSFANSNRLSALNWNNVWLGQSQWPDNTASASYNEVRIWQGVLTEEELERFHAFGPDLINPGQAGVVRPGDGEVDVALDTDLEWLPGYYAASHDLYVGTDMAAVEAASRTNTAGLLVAEQGLTGTTYSFSEPLQLDQTYYWRVDAVNAPPDNTIFTGAIWSFTAEPTLIPMVPIAATASSQYSPDSGPEKTIGGLATGLNELDQHSTESSDMWSSSGDDPNGAWIQYEFSAVQSLGQLLIWNSNQSFEFVLGVGIKEATIELSEDGVTWTQFGDTFVFNRATSKGDYTANTTIDFGGARAKFVRINALNNWGNGAIVSQVGLSEVRFLAIPTAARRPEPASGSTLATLDDQLVWRAGRGAVDHQLFLSTDRALVEAADPSVLVATLQDRRYSLTQANLLYDEKYFWRVDEVNGASVIPGPVWDFNTPEYLVIDDMESYDDDEGTRIFDIWIDGYTSATNGSTVGHLTAPFAEEAVVLGGNQSMPFYYDNTGGIESSADLAIGGANWNRGGVQSLTLFFLGERDNTGGQLFVEIGGTRVICPASLSLGIWKQWDIDVSQFGSKLNNVSTLTVGVTGAGSGLVYIDEIGLYRVAPNLANAASVDPGTNGLVLQYTMDADSLADSSGQGLDGTPQGGPLFTDGLAGLGRALSFDGIDDYVDVPVGNVIPTLTDCTFSIWVNIDPESTANWARAFDFGTDNTNYVFLSPRAGGATGAVEFEITTPSTDVNDVNSGRTLTAGWHHCAAVIEGNVMRLYVDGVLTDTDTTQAVPADLGVTTNNWLGQSQFEADDLFWGLLDEFRIYNRALSAGEIRFLAGDQ